MNPDMAITSLGQDKTMASDGNAGHSDLYDPAVVYPMVTDLATGGSPVSGHSCGLWWQHGPCTSTQISASVGP